jgi:hypothetical protein
MAALVRDRLDAIYSCLGQSSVGGSAKAAKQKIGWGERVVTVKLDLKPEVEAAPLAQSSCPGLVAGSLSQPGAGECDFGQTAGGEEKPYSVVCAVSLEGTRPEL